MKNRSVILLAIAFAVCLVFLGMSAPAVAQSECSATVGTEYVLALDSGLYKFQMNEWDSSLQECVNISGLGFTITTADFTNATNGAPATYTSIYRGCHWGNCTTSNPFPIEESNIASASTSVSITQPSGSQNDAAYDIWFNQTSTTSGQPNGTEIMIWINHQGAPQPYGSEVATTTIDGASYNVWTGNEGWNVISYVATSPVTSASLNLLPFFADAVSRGSLETTWWLIDVEYGFEIWTGGDGLAMSGFSVSAAAGSGGSCSAVPSAPSGLTGTAASSSVINLSWTADTAPANCTISGYNVFQSTTSGFTPSSSNQIASGVTSTSYSNTGLAASTTYYYKIEAVDSEGTSAASSQASAKTSGGGSCTTVPSAPSGLSATAASSSVINLSWTADTPPANCTISGYNVYGSTTSGFTPSSSNLIASGVTSTSYSNTGLAASTTHYYKIEAVDADGASAASSQASATTSASGGGGGSSTCTIDYTISPQNSSAFGAAITIKNTGTTALTSWTLTWAFANGQKVAQLWNGIETQSGANVTVKNESYNGSIAAGGSYTGVGFNGTWNGATNAVPTAFSLNGTSCTVN